MATPPIKFRSAMSKQLVIEGLTMKLLNNYPFKSHELFAAMVHGIKWITANVVR